MFQIISCNYVNGPANKLSVYLASTVECHLSKLIGMASHLDMQKILDN